MIFSALQESPGLLTAHCAAFPVDFTVVEEPANMVLSLVEVRTYCQQAPLGQLSCSKDQP